MTDHENAVSSTLDYTYFAVLGLQSECESVDFGEFGFLRRVQDSPGALDVIRASNDLDAGLTASLYGGSIDFELAFSRNVFKSFQEARGFALALPRVLGIRTGVSIAVPVACSQPWSSVSTAATRSLDISVVQDVARLYVRQPAATVAENQIIDAFAEIDDFVKLYGDDTRFSMASLAFSDADLQENTRMAAAMLWSGIEAIFEIKAELRYRLASLIAAALEPIGAQRRDLYRRVFKSYDVRSKIVHGGYLREAQIVSHFLEARELLRRLLAKLLDIKQVPRGSDLEVAMYTSPDELLRS